MSLLNSLRPSHALHNPVTALTLFFLILPPGLVPAESPAWWQQRGVLIQPGVAADDFALANQGQVKHLAKAAAAEFDVSLLGGAGDELHSLIGSWNVPSSATDDFASVNIGQLKGISKLFFDRLITAGYATSYPWASSTGQSNDYAAANIGQLKHLFSFDLVKDSDGDGLPDMWEIAHGLNPHSADTGNTGISDAYKDSTGTGVPNRNKIKSSSSTENPGGDDPNNNPEDPTGTGQVLKNDPAVKLTAFGYALP